MIEKYNIIFNVNHWIINENTDTPYVRIRSLHKKQGTRSNVIRNKDGFILFELDNLEQDGKIT